MKQGFWILLAKLDNPESAEHLYLEMSRWHAYERVLPVFSSEEKAVAFARRVGDQHAGKAPTPIKLTQGELRDRAFRGVPGGRCVVDPTPDHAREEITVEALRLP